MTTYHRFRSRILVSMGLLLLGLLFGLAINPLHVGAGPSQAGGVPALERRVARLENDADDAADRMDYLERVVEGLVLALEELTIRVDELDGGGNGGGGGGGGAGGAGNQDMDGDGFTPNQGDCDDLDPTTFPGAVEIVGDLIDNDCDGQVDEEE